MCTNFGDGTPYYYTRAVRPSRDLARSRLRLISPTVPTHIPYYYLYDWKERSAVACTLVDLRGEHNDVIGSKTYALECHVLKVLQSCELPASRCRVCFVAVWPVACGTGEHAKVGSCGIKSSYEEPTCVPKVLSRLVVLLRAQARLDQMHLSSEGQLCKL